LRVASASLAFGHPGVQVLAGGGVGRGGAQAGPVVRAGKPGVGVAVQQGLADLVEVRLGGLEQGARVGFVERQLALVAHQQVVAGDLHMHRVHQEPVPFGRSLAEAAHDGRRQGGTGVVAVRRAGQAERVRQPGFMRQHAAAVVEVGLHVAVGAREQGRQRRRLHCALQVGGQFGRGQGEGQGEGQLIHSAIVGHCAIERAIRERFYGAGANFSGEIS